VLLTTGRFSANLDMVFDYNHDLMGFMTTNAPGFLGHGLHIVYAIAADAVNLDLIQMRPTVQANSAPLIAEGLHADRSLMIYAQGKRFVDDLSARDVFSAAEITHTGIYGWLVVDLALADASGVFRGYVMKELSYQGWTPRSSLTR